MLEGIWQAGQSRPISGSPGTAAPDQQAQPSQPGFAGDTYTASSAFQTIPAGDLPPSAPTAHRRWWHPARLTGRPVYDALYGVRKGLVKNPELRGPQAKTIGMLGVGAELANLAEGGPTLGNIGDDAGILAR